MIRHTVVFKLKHEAGSENELNFLRAAQKLAEIPSVNNFECLQQVSEKNNFDFGLSMEFTSQEGYLAYNEHPDHIQFVETLWIPEVVEFMEIDYIPYSES
jgi:hypothetical protein